MIEVLNTSGVYVEKAPARWVAIVEAVLAAHPDLSATWIGGVHPDYTDLAHAVEARSDGRIRFPGGRPHADVLQILQTPGKVLLVSSDIEVFPLSIMEATARGTPVVTRRFLGAAEVLGPDYPYAFDDIDEGIERLAAVINDYGHASALARDLFKERFARNDAWFSEIDAFWSSLLDHP